MKKVLLSAILILFIIFSSAFVLIYNQRQLIKEAQLLQSMGKPLMAISLYERVLLNYVPLSPYNKKAIDGIERICPNLNDKRYKLYCEETLRSSLYQIRSIFIPYGEKIREAEKRILLLKTELYIEHNQPPQDRYEKIYQDLKAMTEYEWYPSVGWSITAIMSLLSWMGCLIFLIWKGFEKTLNKKAILIGLIGFILFFSVWLIGLYLA